MLTYDNADIYEVHAMVDNLLDGVSRLILFYDVQIVFIIC